MTDLNKLFAQAEESLDKEEQWIRLEEEGDQFTMLVTGYSIVENQYGEYPVIRGNLADGTEAVFAAMRTAVNKRLTDNPPAKGDVLSVRYLGEKHNPKTDRTFNAYRVVLIPGEGSASAPAMAEATAADSTGDEW